MKYIKVYFLMMIGITSLSAIYLPFSETEATSSQNMINLSTDPSNRLFYINNLAPGDIISKTIQINNKGNTNSEVEISASRELGDQRLYDALELSIMKNGIIQFQGKLAELKNIKLGEVVSSSSETYELLVGLPLNEGNNVKKKTTAVAFNFVGQFNNNTIQESLDGKKLPSTATNIYNNLLIGLAMLVIGTIILLKLRHRKIKQTNPRP